MKTVTYQREYKKESFSCGKPSLDNYIQRNATKDVKAGACTCFVLVDEAQKVCGYYTLSSESIPIDEAPEKIKKTIKYSRVPVILLGRLAVDSAYAGKGYGKFLLIDALYKSVSVAKTQVGAVAVIVDPLDEEAEAFYSRFGFELLPDCGRMMMTIKKIENALQLGN